jgi:hypothetical protein
MDFPCSIRVLASRVTCALFRKTVTVEIEDSSGFSSCAHTENEKRAAIIKSEVFMVFKYS